MCWQALDELDARGISKDDPRRLLLLRVIKAYQIQQGALQIASSNTLESVIPSTKTKTAQVLRSQLSAYSYLVHGTSVPASTLSFIKSNAKLSREATSSDTGDHSASGNTSEAIVSEKVALRIAKLTEMIPMLQNYPTLLEEAQTELKKLKLLGLQRKLRHEIKREQDRLLCLQSAGDIDVAFQHTIQHSLVPEMTIGGSKVEQSRRREDFWILAGRAHSEWIVAVLLHSKQFFEDREKIMTQKRKLFKRLQKWHLDKERKETQMKEKLERDRLAALKRNDEVAYLALLEQTKNKRLLHLIEQTDTYLAQIGAKVQESQRLADAKLLARHGETADSSTDITTTQNEDVSGTDSDKKPYYSTIHRVIEQVTKQPTLLVGGELKEYQMDGLTWLVSLFNNRLNGILADEMGLGKTVQTIALICHLYETKKMTGPFLVVVPLSTLSNWALEFQKWAPELHEKLVLYKGTPPGRKRIWQTQLSSAANKDWSIVLTTFDYVIKDRLPLARVKWGYVIVDEGHRMKNHNCKLSTTLSQHYDSQFRLILTGTPLQNSLPELWSLLNFLLPSIFHSVENFEKWFNKPFANTGEEVKMNEEESLLVIQRLHKVLRPFLLRRLKSQVEAQLPEKIERIIKVEMSAWQKHMYKHAKNGLVATQSTDGTVGSRGVLNSLMQLRKICDHPFMMRHSLNDVEYDDLLWRTSGKMELLDRILPKLKACGHRVLMFSQFTTALDVLEMYFRYRDFTFMRLDGSTKAEERGELLAKFNAPDSPYFVFILSTRAGGLGLNLQTADTVILFDSDWNPQADLQAQDRAHRIGQKNDVLVIRLATQNSVEERILEAANYKLDLDSKIIQAGMFNKNSTSTDRRTFLMNLLKEGGEDEDEIMDVPDPKQVNAIIARSDQEYKIFQQMDRDSAEAEKQLWLQAGNTGPPPSRLVTDEEVPEYLKADLTELRFERELRSGKRATRSATATEMTDDEFMRLVEEEDANSSNPMNVDDINEFMEAGDEGDEDGELEATRNDKKRKASSMSTATPAENLRDDMMETWTYVTQFQDHRGYSLAIPFMDLPTEELAPNYFQLVTSPMSFNVIKNKIANFQYPTMQAFLEDNLQVFQNAHVYNLETSQICIDAEILKQALLEKMEQVAKSRQEADTALLEAQAHEAEILDPNAMQGILPSDSSTGTTVPEPKKIVISFKKPVPPPGAPTPSMPAPAPVQRPKIVSKPIIMKVPVNLADSSDDEDDDGFADSELRGTGGSFEVRASDADTNN